MKALLTAVALSSFIAAPVFAGDINDVMSGNALQLSNTEMQQTVGAGYSTSIAISSNYVTNQALLGSIHNGQRSRATTEAVAPHSYWWRSAGNAYSQASSGNTAHNVTIGGSISNSQSSSARAYAY